MSTLKIISARCAIFICSVVGYVAIDEAKSEAEKIDFLNYDIDNSIRAAHASFSVMLPLALVLFLYNCFVYSQTQSSLQHFIRKMQGFQLVEQSSSSADASSPPQPKYEVYITQLLLQILTEALSMAVALYFIDDAYNRLDGKYDKWSPERRHADVVLGHLQDTINASIPYVVFLAAVMISDFASFLQISFASTSK
eukprot:TRINITY_DN2833_c0_g1_i1.p1 TRINITY_DN2833_c0_g1~~TRINITY_DN2833_c0_g1_i1.p1  ORF type:complete len:196 (-),score=58.62 TRINITY_DN2833_c0_g1_i1:2014-2601(-)